MKAFLKENLVNFIVFALCFCGALVFFSAYFIASSFGAVDFSQILFHLRFPLLDNENTIFIGTFLKKVILPSFLIAFCVAFAPLVVKMLKLFYELILLRFFYHFILRVKTAKIIFAVVLVALFLNMTNNKLKITRYFKTQQTYSNLYENHYKAFDTTSLQDFSRQNHQNLIVIIAESFESTFSSQNVPANASNSGQYSPFGELIPHLTQLALNHTNFSSTQTLGGINQLSGTGWTIAGTIGYLCGIPLNMPIEGNEFKNKHFLSSAPCISDILANLGYEQVYFSNFDSAFGGNKYFFETHKVKVLDLPYFQSQNLLPNPLPRSFFGLWGLKDAKLFEFARNYLETMNSKPFAMYISTIDTHSPDGFVDNEFCPNWEQNYQNAISCSDKIIGDFVEFVRKSPFGKNTTIVILGDHLSMKQNFFPRDSKRAIFNAFINAKFTKEPKGTKNRELSHFDISPLILDSLGIKAEFFGLGRNPLYHKSLIESEFSIEEFNKELGKRNKIYDSFWEVKK